MPETKTLVLDKKKVEQKIDRIAYEIYENNHDEKEIIMAGIDGNGYVLAEKLSKRLQDLSPIKVNLVKITIDKEANMPGQPVCSLTEKDFKNKVIVLVDDVLNSGKTLIYAAKYFLTTPVKRLRTVVLVDRDHKRFPIKADYIGLSLGTTLKEHISVEFGKEAGVYLQ